MDWLLPACWVLSAAFVGWIFVGYPLSLLLKKDRPVSLGNAGDGERCSIVIAAHNEEHTLPRKLRSLLQGPDSDRISEIWVGSDGSTDGTVEAVRSIDDPRIRVWVAPERRGKPALLNILIPRCSEAVLLCTDARQRLAPGGIDRLLAVMQAPDVVAVSGELMFEVGGDASATTEGMGFYWNYEKYIRRHEARSGSVPGVTGAFYAIRREAVPLLPEDTLLDDVAIPMAAMEQTGGRCLFEAGAIAWDRPSTSTGQEGMRKRRTIAGVIQLLRRHPGWCWAHPCGGAFFHHKVLRLFAPAGLGLMLVLPLFSLDAWWAKVALAVQAVFYVLALIGRLTAHHAKPVRLFSVPYMFAALNGVTLLAWKDALQGRFSATWERSSHTEIQRP